MDSQIQDYVRHAASRDRDVERVGAFVATFTPGSDNPYLNYAIPDAGAKPSPGEIRALVEAFRRRGLKPRLEYLPGLAPAVEAALVCAGFAVEDRVPVMVCAPGEERDVPAPEGIEIISPSSEDELNALSLAQSEAFGGGVPPRSEAAAKRAFIEAGGIEVLARDAATGEPAGGGVCDVPSGGTSELAGLGVRPAFRRRGIAAAMTSYLAREAFARGVTTLFLTPGDEAAERIYRRAGFRATEIAVVFISLARDEATDSKGELHE